MNKVPTHPLVQRLNFACRQLRKVETAFIGAKVIPLADVATIYFHARRGPLQHSPLRAPRFSSSTFPPMNPEP